MDDDSDYYKKAIEGLSDHDLKRAASMLSIAESKPKKYVPHPSQMVLHKSRKSIGLAIAGNRSGKSYCGAQELIWRLTGTHPYKPTSVPIKAWAGSYDFPNGVGKIILPKVMALLEQRQITHVSKNSQGIVDRIELINGSTVDFKSYEQDSMKWEGEDLDFLWLDEPPPRAHWIAATRGLIDRNGDALITATPIREPWVFEELWQPGVDGTNEDIECVRWSSYDNPHVDAVALKKFEMSLSPEDREVRIHGKFKQLVGRVFSRFKNAEPFVIKGYPWPRDWPYYEGLDPHLSKPHGFVRVGITPDGDCVVFHCSRPIGTMDEISVPIQATRPHHMLPMDTIADTSLSVFDQNMGMTMRDRLEQAGVPTTLAYKRDQLIPGLELMQQMFYNTEANLPQKLLVMEECEEFIMEVMRLRWKLKSDDKTEGDDDLIDPVRYILSMEPWDRTRIGLIKGVNAGYNLGYKSEDKYKGVNNGLVSRSFDYDEDEEDDDGAPVMRVRY